MVSKSRLIKLTQRLIRVDSQNPGSDESVIAGLVAERLKKLGLRTRIYEFKKRRSNVVAVLEGKTKKPSLLVTPHLDTVPAGRSWSTPPLEPRIYKNRIYGLGATDCKGNLAVALEAIQSLVEERIRLDYNLVFAATADEETGSALGLIPLLERGILKVDAALVLDSDDFDIVVTQKGLLHLKVKIQGKKAHGAYPWRGINAIDIAVDILKELKAHKFHYIPSAYLRPPTMNIGTIKGGDKVNVVADWCEFELDFRFLPGGRVREILAYLKKVIGKYARRFKVEIEGIQQPYVIDKRHALVAGLARSAAKFNIKPGIKGSEGATTITFFQDKNIPAIATGFGSEGCAHVADEYATVANLYKGALVLEDFLKHYER